MRRAFALVLLALLLGLGVVALVQTDPGYVLLAYRNYTLETSLWVGILLLLLFTLLVYALVRLLRRLFSGQHSVLGWMGARKARQSARLTNRGLINYIEGNWQKSRRQLLRGARHHEAPLLNYLVAARASYQLDEVDKMREYLGAAERTDAEAGIAVELTQAEMKLHARQYEQAAATLVRARRNAGRHPYVLDLLHRAYRGLEDWDSLAELLPDLRRHDVLGEQELQNLERSIFCARLGVAAERDGADALHRAWKSLPAVWRHEQEVERHYIRLLLAGAAHEAAEKACAQALQRHWDSELVRLYGLARGADAGKQLAEAESWLQAHEQDPELLLCLGRLCARNSLWGKSRDYLERSYRARRTPEVCAELGRLLAALGEPAVSARYYGEGLLREVRLPELPLPEAAMPFQQQDG